MTPLKLMHVLLLLGGEDRAGQQHMRISNIASNRKNTDQNSKLTLTF